MCGIAGLLHLEPATASPRGSVELARGMSATLAHRGPDDEGVWESSDRSVVLAHRRLAIVDLSPLGRNPMAWDGGRLQITFNGEIYNFLELRRELERAGHRFRSQTDTEVILAAYDEWGLESLSRLVGMFAFALWDERLRQLWLVRDRLGKKPLYYTATDGVLRFASELKALVADPSVRCELDADAMRLYLRYGYVPSPSTVYRDVKKVPPGHFLLVRDGAVAVKRYWDPVEYACRKQRLSDEDAESELERLLSQSVRQRRIADVPLGAFLSGGIDSSLVTALMQEQSSAKVKTFTIRFDNPAFNEADDAARVADFLGTEHYERTCSDQDLLDTVERLPAMFDEPFADSSAVPTYLVSKVARERVTVALSGDGGDELFFGYPRYLYHASSAWLWKLPPPLLRTAARIANALPQRRIKRIADVLTNDDADRYSRFVTWWSQADIVALTGQAPAAPVLYDDARRRAAEISADERPLLLDLVSYLPEDILTKVDRASMAVSLEVRAPLLDHRVVEFALGLPLGLKLRGRESKWLLRRLLYKRVPQRLLDRPKMGFGVPLADFFRGPLREDMNRALKSTVLEDLGIEASIVRGLWTDFLAGRRHRVDLLWQIYMLIAWSRAMRSDRSGQAKLASAAISR
jgi:asparagine synthase (glutamine-hydrolysing)